MGGSFALACKRAGLVKRVVGYSKSPSTTEQARRLGVIDTAAESALLAVSGSDIVLLAVPVSAMEATFKAIRHLIEPGVLMMDVGSTKRDVVDAARRVLKDRIGSFVPTHPIAGKEVSGISHADATLYQGRQVILTPLAEDVARTGPEGDRHLGRDRLARAAHDAREPRRRVRRGEPPAAHPGLRLFQLGGAAAGRPRLPLARRPGLSRLHADRREQSGGLARHPDGQPRRDPEADASASGTRSKRWSTSSRPATPRRSRR